MSGLKHIFFLWKLVIKFWIYLILYSYLGSREMIWLPKTMRKIVRAKNFALVTCTKNNLYSKQKLTQNADIFKKQMPFYSINFNPGLTLPLLLSRCAKLMKLIIVSREFTEYRVYKKR
jgi:hypothetical protein